MENLEEIYFSDNHLTEFPYELLELPKLRRLILDKNQITKVDFMILEENNTTLKILDLSNNQINQTDYFSKLQGLEVFYLSGNSLTSFSFLNDDLKSIDLRQNQLASMPSIKSKNLKKVDLSGNKLTKLELSFLSKTISELDVHNNKIKKVTIDNFRQFVENSDLTTINLESNDLPEFPNDLLHLRKLTTLNLSHNKIRTWNYIAHYSNLSELNLSYNWLSAFPHDFKTSMYQLKKLDISNNLFSTIKINHKYLTSLSIQNNDFAMVELNLPILRYLNCDSNHFNHQTENIVAPSLKNCNVQLKDNTTALSAEVKMRYKFADFFYN